MFYASSFPLQTSTRVEQIWTSQPPGVGPRGELKEFSVKTKRVSEDVKWSGVGFVEAITLQYFKINPDSHCRGLLAETREGSSKWKTI